MFDTQKQYFSEVSLLKLKTLLDMVFEKIEILYKNSTVHQKPHIVVFYFSLQKYKFHKKTYLNWCHFMSTE